MQAQAVKKYIRSSPRKMRLVIDLIRGKKAIEALNTLKMQPQLASKDVEMLLRSALSNLQNKADDEGEVVRDEDVRISECYSNQGPTVKRIMPAPMGRAFRVRKRSNHLTIVVSTDSK